MAILAPNLAQLLRQGMVIPAHPLALTADLKMDERHQRALTRYYGAAGVGGVAVGVHTTQFEIHTPETGLYEPVLALAAETVDESLRAHPRPFIKIAGLIGPTQQAVHEAGMALAHGYHAGLLSLAALRHASDDEMVAHVSAVAEIIPVMGFYLQPAVGGRILPYSFWRRMAEIENVVAIKIAPFNRYQTLDVVRAVAEAGRGGDIALYTGNDDNIVPDLITDFYLAPLTAPASALQENRANGTGANTSNPHENQPAHLAANSTEHNEGAPVRIVGGLLGQWAVWTERVVSLLTTIQQQRAANSLDYGHWLAYGAQLTDANAAIFDVVNNFRGSIAGIHWILHQQGLMQGTWALNPQEKLSPGQVAEMERVCAAYPHLNDNEFVAAHLDEWLR
jgi:dihydrodipicolinate synthase/N-acetylneuraminate lyase